MNDAPLFHSKYTLWTIAGASLVVVAATARVLAGASAALLAVAAWGIALLVLGVGSTSGSAGWTDPELPEEVTD